MQGKLWSIAMSASNLRLGDDELRALRDLMMGRPTRLPSSHRVRLEMLGLLNDGPDGPKLTSLAKRYVSTEQAASTSSAASPMPEKLDKKGRRMPFRRTWPGC